MFIGGLYTTKGVERLLIDGEISHEELWECVSRHQRRDYGDTDKHDIMINESNFNHNAGNVMSSYTINNNVIWIITSLGDDITTHTTILLPSEY